MIKSLASRFGEDPKILTNGDMLAPIRSSRSLLTGSHFGRNRPFINPEPPFINEDQAIKEDRMEGVSELPLDTVEQLGSGIVSSGLKLAGALGTAKAVGKIAKKVVTGPIGTFISNKLSEKFNDNPEWRPGFPGEAHLVLPTKHGLTRANFCGPGTNLLARLKRGDRGVSQVDTACSKHDMLYHLAKTQEDIRAADEQLKRDIDASDAGRIQRGILKAGLKAKTLGEDVGIFNPETFTKLPGLEGSGMIPNISEAARSLLSRNGRMHNANIACSLINRVSHGGPLSQLCRMQGAMHRNSIFGAGRLVSNPQEATDLSRRKHLDPNIANMQGRNPAVLGRIPTFKKGTELISRSANILQEQGGEGIIEDSALRFVDRIADKVKDSIEKPAQKLRKVVMQDIQRTRRKKSKIRLAVQPLSKGRGVQSGGQFGILASLAASFIIPKIISAITGKKGKGLGLAGAGMHQGKGLKLQELLKEINKLKKKKNPGHALGEQLLKMHGLTPSKLHKLGITEKKLIPVVKKFLMTNKQAGVALQKDQSGGQFGILASLAASFIIPKIISAITGK